MKILLGPGINDPKGNEAFLVSALKRNADVRLFDSREIPQPKDGWSPDCIVVRDAEYYSIPPGLEDVPVPVIGLIGDYNLTLPRMLPIMGIFDHILCDSCGVVFFRRLGHENTKFFCLYGYAPELHKNYGLKKQCDIIFVGNLNFSVQQDRAWHLHNLLKMRDKYKIIIASNVYGEDYARLLNTSRLVINLPARGELNMRFFEAFGCHATIMQRELFEARTLGFEIGEHYGYIDEDLMCQGSNAEFDLNLYIESIECAMDITVDPTPFLEYTYDARAKALIKIIDDSLSLVSPEMRAFRRLSSKEKTARWTAYQAQEYNVYPYGQIRLFDERLVRYEKDVIENCGDIPNFNFEQWAWWIDLMCTSGYNHIAQQFISSKEDELRCFSGFSDIKEKLRVRLNTEMYGFSV